MLQHVRICLIRNLFPLSRAARQRNQICGLIPSPKLLTLTLRTDNRKPASGPHGFSDDSKILGMKACLLVFSHILAHRRHPRNMCQDSEMTMQQGSCEKLSFQKSFHPRRSAPFGHSPHRKRETSTGRHFFWTLLVQRGGCAGSDRRS